MWIWFLKLIGRKCQRPGCRRIGRKRRQNTSYSRKEYNYEVLCRRCQEATDDYYHNLWKQYKSSQGV